MSELELGTVAHAARVHDPGAAERIAALAAAGAGRFDAVAFHYIKQLANRTPDQPPAVRSLLDQRLEQAIETLMQRFAHARQAAAELAAKTAERFPEASAGLMQQLAGGEFATLRRTVAGLESSCRPSELAELSERLADSEPGSLAPTSASGERRELKAIRYFRHTWSALSLDLQVSNALSSAPENAGPLNSHLLVLRALEQMREISPEYLRQFVSYADTLLSLEQIEVKAKATERAPAKKVAGARRTKS